TTTQQEGSEVFRPSRRVAHACLYGNRPIGQKNCLESPGSRHHQRARFRRLRPRFRVLRGSVWSTRLRGSGCYTVVPACTLLADRVPTAPLPSTPRSRQVVHVASRGSLRGGSGRHHGNNAGVKKMRTWKLLMGLAASTAMVVACS